MSMKLAILGLLMEGDRHPYEISHTLKERKMDHFFKIQDGSLYYAIDRLREGGYVEAVEVVKASHRPDKTIYRVTEKGKRKFQQLLIAQLEQKNGFFHPIYAGLAFSLHGDERQMADALERKIEQCELEARHMKEIYYEHIPIVPRSVLHLMWGRYEHLLTELEWLKRVYADARANRLKDRGADPGWERSDGD